MGSNTNIQRCIVQLLLPELTKCLEKRIKENQLPLEKESEETVGERLEEEVNFETIRETGDGELPNYKEEFSEDECTEEEGDDGCIDGFSEESFEEDVEYLEDEAEYEEENLKFVENNEGSLRYDEEDEEGFSELKVRHVETSVEEQVENVEYEEESIVKEDECDEKQFGEEVYYEEASNDETECEEGEEKYEEDSVEVEGNPIELPRAEDDVKHEEEISEVEVDYDEEKTAGEVTTEDGAEYVEELDTVKEETVDKTAYGDFNVEVPPKVSVRYFEESQEEHAEESVYSDVDNPEEFVAEEEGDQNGKVSHDYEHEFGASEMEGQVNDEECADTEEGEFEGIEELTVVEEEVVEGDAERGNYAKGSLEVPQDLEVSSFTDDEERKQVYAEGNYTDEEEVPGGSIISEETQSSSNYEKGMQEVEGGYDEEEEYTEGTAEERAEYVEGEEARENIDCEDDNVEVPSETPIHYFGDSEEEWQECMETNAYDEMEYVGGTLMEEEDDRLKIIPNSYDYRKEQQAEEEGYDGKQSEEKYNKADEDDVENVSFEGSCTKFCEGEQEKEEDECADGTVDLEEKGIEGEEYGWRKDQNGKELPAGKSVEKGAGEKQYLFRVESNEQEERAVDEFVEEPAIVQRPFPSKRCLLTMAKIIYPELAKCFETLLGSVEV
ncbi:hypothetical protein Aperf_G00000104346 [Anoplocephala perfoliata]